MDRLIPSPRIFWPAWRRKRPAPFSFQSNKRACRPAPRIAGILLPLVTAAYDWRLAILTAGIMAEPRCSLHSAVSEDRWTWFGSPKQTVRVGDIAKPLGTCLVRFPAPLPGCGRFFLFRRIQVAMMTFYVVYLTAALALPLTKAGLIFTLLQLGAILGRLFWGTVADRYYPANLHAYLARRRHRRICRDDKPIQSLPGHFWTIGMTSFLLGTTSAGWNGSLFLGIGQVRAGRSNRRSSQRHASLYHGRCCGHVPPIFGAIVAVTDGYGVAFLMQSPSQWSRLPSIRSSFFADSGHTSANFGKWRRNCNNKLIRQHGVVSSPIGAPKHQRCARSIEFGILPQPHLFVISPI